MSDDIRETLEARGATYGSFDDHAAITQGLKDVVRTGKAWHSMSASQKECLDMVMHKIGRIVNGDPYYIESWRDCVGYIQLVIDELKVTYGATDSKVTKIQNVDGVWEEV